MVIKKAAEAETKKQLNYNNRYSKFIVVFTFAYLFLAYTAFICIDLYNIFGLSGKLEESGIFPPILWFLIFMEGSITELLQWLLLSLAIIFAIYCGGLKITVSSSSPIKWFFFQFGLMLMLAEDMFNVRHVIVDRLAYFFHADVRVFKESILGSLTELCIYAIIGFCMIIFFIVTIYDKEESNYGKRLLIGGYVLYGIASIASATRYINNWYSALGGVILSSLTDSFSIDWAARDYVRYNSLGFWFIDLVVEESLELLGATYLLAAIVAFVSFTKRVN